MNCIVQKLKWSRLDTDPNQLDYLEAHSPTDELDLFSVPHSPFLSPCLASDAALKKLPPISLLVSDTLP